MCLIPKISLIVRNGSRDMTWVLVHLGKHEVHGNDPNFAYCWRHDSGRQHLIEPCKVPKRILCGRNILPANPHCLHEDPGVSPR